MLIRQNTCSTCAFKVGIGQELYCRFNPPLVYPVMGMGPNGKPAVAGQMSLFPKVEPTWWCGRWGGVSVGIAANDLDQVEVGTRQ